MKPLYVIMSSRDGGDTWDFHYTYNRVKDGTLTIFHCTVLCYADEEHAKAYIQNATKVGKNIFGEQFCLRYEKYEVVK